MPGNIFGNIFRLTTFGESHGKAIGGVIDGCPPNQEIDIELISKELERRRPGQSSISSPRDEKDKVEFLSGIFEGRTLGTPVAFIVKNNDEKSSDYDEIKNIFRPSHADYTYFLKYGHRDHRGGGRSSARETISRVVAGAIAKQILQAKDISIIAWVSQVGNIKLEKDYHNLDLSLVDSNMVRCPDNETAEMMIRKIEETKAEGDSVGGIISCVILNLPAGLGEPVFDKLHADLGKAILGISAVKGFDYGSGFEMADKKGSEVNDIFTVRNGKIRTLTNFSGGIQGGISNGEEIFFRAVFKPVPTIMKRQDSIDTDLKIISFVPKGRHDVCVLPRAVPIVEAMAAVTVLDHLLMSKIYSF